MANLGIVPRATEAPPTHPEEMRASCEIRFSDKLTLQASARITPAGVVCVGIAAAAITLAACWGAALIRRSGRG